MAIAIEREKDVFADPMIDGLNDENNRIEQIIRKFDRVCDSQKDERLCRKYALHTIGNKHDDAENVADQTRYANNRDEVQTTDNLNTFEQFLVAIVRQQCCLVRLDGHAEF